MDAVESGFEVPPVQADGAGMVATYPSPWQGVRRAAKTGWRWALRVSLPIGFVYLVVGLIPSMIGLGAGYGFNVHPLAVRAVVVAVGIPLAAALLGTVLGLIGSLIRWAGLGRGGWWAIANRKVPFPWNRPRILQTAGVTLARRLALWNWRRLAFWLLGAPAVVVLVSALIGGIVAGRFVDRRLTAAIADADRADPRWRLVDLMNDMGIVPDEENGAIVVDEALALAPQNWPRAPLAAPFSPKPEPSPVEKAYDRLEATEGPTRLDDETAGTLREELESLEDAVILARTVADYRRGQHAIELTPGLIDTLLPETFAVRDAARLLVADAAIRAQDGDIDGALQSCRAILGVARSIGGEPFLISHLTRAVIGGMAANAVRHVLAQDEPSEEVLEQLQDEILDAMRLPLWLEGVRGERAMMDELIRRVRDAEIPISSLDGTPHSDKPIPAVSPWGKLAFDHQRALGLEWMNRLVENARRPPFERAPARKALDAEIARVRARWFAPIVASMPLALMPGALTAEVGITRSQAELGATAILLAAERQRRRTGEWPASIEAMDPEILPTPPVDPFSGQPYRIERRDGEFSVYSVGPNLKDDHGEFDKETWRLGGPDDVGTRGWDVALRGQPSSEPSMPAPE